MIPIVFYGVVLSARMDLGALRKDGWLFDVGASEAWWKFYTYFGELFQFFAGLCRLLIL